MKDQETDAFSAQKQSQVMVGGALGAGFVILTQCLQASELSWALTYAVFFLAVSLPVLTLAFSETLISKPNPRSEALELGGVLLFLVGLVSMLFHFGKVIGLAFIASTALCVIVIAFGVGGGTKTTADS